MIESEEQAKAFFKSLFRSKTIAEIQAFLPSFADSLEDALHYDDLRGLIDPTENPSLFKDKKLELLREILNSREFKRANPAAKSGFLNLACTSDPSGDAVEMILDCCEKVEGPRSSRFAKIINASFMDPFQCCKPCTMMNVCATSGMYNNLEHLLKTGAVSQIHQNCLADLIVTGCGVMT